jgi:plasmid stabilization system protein ParE
MPTSFQLTPRALDDIDGIWDYIARENVNAANRVESAIFSACRSLAVHLLPVRFWTITRFPNFIVIYRPDTKPLQVIAVLHGKRNLRALLEESPAL